MSIILGINAFHAGASAAVVADGKIVAAIAEERLNRVKYFAGFPSLAIRKCLEMAGVTINEVDHVALGRDSASNRAKKSSTSSNILRGCSTCSRFAPRERSSTM